MGSKRKVSPIVFVTGWHPGTSSANTEHNLEIQEDTILRTSANEIKFELSGLLLGCLTQLAKLCKT